MGLTRARQRLLRRIATRRGREAEGVVLVEGPRVLSTALANEARVLFIVREEGRWGGTRLTDSGLHLQPETEIVDVESGVLDEFSSTEASQGILAVVLQPEYAMPAAEHGPPCVLVLDGVQDPGNAGALTRAAAALGMGWVVALSGTADLWGAKAVRASAGFAFAIPTQMLEWPRMQNWLDDNSVGLLVADPRGRDVRDWIDEDRRSTQPGGSGFRSWALVVGNEAAGPRQEVLDRADACLSIPLVAGVDSLNVATAGAILMWSLGPARTHEGLGAF